MVFYQNQDKKAWLGPVPVFSVQKSSIFLFANGSMKKVPRCNVKLCNSEGEEEPKTGCSVEPDGKSLPPHCSKSPIVNFEEENFGEDITEKETEESRRRRT